jgi:hypothetical protein
MELLERYVGGDCVGVWREVCDAGEATPEADAVARELMGRIARNVDTVVSRLEAAGWRFLHTPARVPPDDEDAELLAEAEEIAGPLPLALTACLSVVGEVCLGGTHPA